MAKGSRFDPTTIIFVLLLIAATILAVAVPAPTWVYLAIISLAIITVAVSAFRNIVLFKIGARSLIRRRGMSLIVIAGLMIGTVIISSSLVIGDTMDNMITEIHYDMFHEIDEMIYADGTDDEKMLFTEDEADSLMMKIDGIDNVEGTTSILETAIFVMDQTSGQTEPGIRLVGYNSSSAEFGSFKKDGRDLPMQLPENEVYIDKKTAEALDASRGDILAIPVGDDFTPVVINQIVDHEGRAYWMGNSIFMDLEDSQKILGLEGMVNMVLVTNDGDVYEGEDHCGQVTNGINEILEGNGIGLEVKRDKHSEVEKGKEEMKQFSQMFLVFGSFSIIAGIILIVNIFVMLGEERKGEMGISRAVGMSRGDLKRTFVYEGTLYSAASSLLGALLGIGVAYLVLVGMDTIFSAWFDDASILDSFSFEYTSLVHAFTFGLLISLVTVSFAASRINKLNIVRAIRNIPEPRIPRDSNRMILVGSILVLVGLGLFGSSLVLFEDMNLKNMELAGIYTGVSLTLTGGALLARRVVGERIAYSVMSMFLIVFWLAPAKWIHLDGYGGGMEMFVLSGIFAVSAGIILFIFNSHQIISAITTLWSFTGRPTATMRTASSYPMKNRFRTGMTIYMFALIVFTITVMSMLVAVMSVNIERITEEQMGDMEIAGISSSHYIIEDIEREIEKNRNLDPADIDDIFSMSTTSATLDDGNRPGDGNRTMEWPLMSVEENFPESGWGFDKMAEGYQTEGEVWEDFFSSDDLAIIDYSFSNVEDDWGPDVEMFPINMGDTIWVETPSGKEQKIVVAMMEQEMIEGVFIPASAAGEQYNLTTPNFFLFDIADGVNEDRMAKDLERELGMETIVLSSMVEMMTRSMEQMFDLFSAFMGLGLVVGIAGLGIITLRAVHERRVEIGMMRVIGFQRHSVTWSFLMEAGFIAFTGILLGTLLGMFLGYTMWYDEFRPLDFEFYIPWMKILFVGGISLLATLLFTVFPSFAASRVAPAEALRYD